MKTKPFVLIESPFAGQVERNKAYAREAMKDCIWRGEIPMVSHLLYTQVLDDNQFKERAIGIGLHLEWLHKVDLVVVYDDFGISPGMKAGIKHAQGEAVPIQYRTLPNFKALWTDG